MKLPDTGNNIYYDPQFLKEFIGSTMFFWRMSYRYTSNWRILHIDGLEGFIFGTNLPVSTGKPIKFFTYAEKA
jgi:hypothetical protein